MIRINFLKRPYVMLILILLISGVSQSGYGQAQFTLDNAVKLAMENSPDIQRTKLDLQRNQELLNAQKAATKSHFSLNLNPFSYQNDLSFNRQLNAWVSSETKESNGTFRISQPLKWTGGTVSIIDRFSWQDSYSDYSNVRNKLYSNNMYLSISQPLFTYNTIRLETREIELDLERTQLTYAIQELQIERQVAQLFYTVYQNKLNVSIAQEELDNQRKSYEIIKNKVEAGLLAQEEYLQAELNLMNSQSSLQNAKVTLESSYDNLKKILGIPLEEMITVDADTTFKAVNVNLTKAIENGLQSRRELRQQQISIENAQFSLIRTEALNEFKGEVNLTYGLTGTNELIKDVYDKATKNQQIELSVEIPLWDWGEKKSRIKAQEAAIQREKLTYDEDITDITIEIRKTYRELMNLELQIEIARKNVRNAQLTYEINLERYEYGDLTSMDLSLYQQQLSQSKTQLVSSLVNYKLALLDLKVQSLWDFEANKAVLQEDIIKFK